MPACPEAEGGTNIPQLTETDPRPARLRFAALGCAGLVQLAILAFSQVGFFWGDEGFHLLAARLVLSGKAPYLDFFYQHPPLFPYLYAVWMRVFGESWRSAHALSAILFGAAIALTARYAASLFPRPAERRTAAALAAGFTALSLDALRISTFALPFALALLLTLAALSLAAKASNRPGSRAAFWAGACAGGAAMASLFTAPVGPILFFWLAKNRGSGKRAGKLLAFAGGMFASSLPLLWPAARAPRRVFLDIVGFHLWFRTGVMAGGAPDPIAAKMRMVGGLLTSPQGILLALFAGFGLLAVFSGRTPRPAESRLTVWIAAGLTLFILAPNPSYQHYFVLVIPLLAVLAVAGLSSLGLLAGAPGLPARAGWIVLGFFILGAGATAHRLGRGLVPFWPDAEKIAAEVVRLTPEGSRIYAPEVICFLSRRMPPPGLENSFGLQVSDPAAAALMGVASERDVDAWISDGRVATVVLPAESERIERLGLSRLYGGRVTLVNGFGPIEIFSGWLGRTGAPTPPERK